MACQISNELKDQVNIIKILAGFSEEEHLWDKLQEEEGRRKKLIAWVLDYWACYIAITR